MTTTGSRLDGMFSFLTPWVKRLIVANVIVFVVSAYFLPDSSQFLAFYPDWAIHPPDAVDVRDVHVRARELESHLLQHDLTRLFRAAC